MAPGKKKNHFSPIVKAIAEAQNNTSGEIRVHLSYRWIEKNPFQRAAQLFKKFNMDKTSHQNAVLFYINLRKKNFAILGDKGIQAKVHVNYWKQLATLLEEDLHSTHYENAIALAIRTVGATLAKHFPIERKSIQ